MGVLDLIGSDIQHCPNYQNQWGFIVVFLYCKLKCAKLTLMQHTICKVTSNKSSQINVAE